LNIGWPAFTAYGMAVSDRKPIPLPLLLLIAAATSADLSRRWWLVSYLIRPGALILYLPILVSAPHWFGGDSFPR
jgi:hypothetical protein